MKVREVIICVSVLLCISGAGNAQEVGANFNHNPEIIDFKYLKKTPVEWVRTTPYIFEYIHGERSPETEVGLAKVIEAHKAGYKVAFGFRWDFKKHNVNVPAPGSAQERKYFQVAAAILERVGSYINNFTLGNEPNLETKAEDLQPDKKGVIPLVQFTERLLTQVVEPYYKKNRQVKRPDIYVGSLPALFEEKHQKTPGVVGLIKMAQENKAIKGLALHLHIKDSLQMEEAFRFVRAIMPRKPIIVPEFSLFRLYNQHLEDGLGSTPEGEAFAKKYGYSPNMKLYEWYSKANTVRVSAQEWKDLFDSRKWFPKNFMQTYHRYFRNYGVVLATYGFMSQSAPPVVTPKTPVWFINPIFLSKSLVSHTNGDHMENPLWFHDYLDIVTKGKKGN